MEIRDATPEEFKTLDQLMIKVYSQLESFPSPEEQPRYYDMLANIGNFTQKEATQLLIALSDDKQILGGVVYFGDMKHYGSGGTTTQMTDGSGIRLLAVDPSTRGQGIGKALTKACIKLAKEKGQSKVYLHTTKAMQTAWGMYERMGFERFPHLDFQQEELPVFGFQLKL